MKKFERLPAKNRKEEIKAAAVSLFLKKGFRATTMENIIADVSLSKGGVYRLYPSTTSILSDLILDGARARNAFYLQGVQQRAADGEQVDRHVIAEIICDGMLRYPEIAEIYSEFLIEKRHIPELEILYSKICRETTAEVLAMAEQAGLTENLSLDKKKIQRLTDVMNTAILGIVILHQRENYERIRPQLLSVLEK